jgi:uncharacterized protein
MRAVRTRIAGASALLALGLLGTAAAPAARGDTSQWTEPVPNDPGGPLYGNPPFAEQETRALEAAVRRASTSDHPITLVLNPAKGMDSLAQRAEELRKAWPDRILLVVSQPDFAVSLAVPNALEDRFPEEQRSRLVHDVQKAMMEATFSRTLVRVVGEIASLAEGRRPPPWAPWRHPLKTLGGGQDEDPAPLALGIVIGVVLVSLVSWFLYMLVTNPKAVLLWIGLNLAEAVIGGLFSGGGGSSGGGGFSGGGGTFGGGGASGSW